MGKLKKIIKTFHFSFLLLLISEYIYTQEKYEYLISGLAKYDTQNPKYDQLLLLDEKVFIKVNDYFEITQEYVIRNPDEKINLKAGVIVLDDTPYQSPEPIPKDIRFWIDDIECNIEIKLHENIQTTQKNEQMRKVNWALVNIDFPRDSIKRIRIQYTNRNTTYLMETQGAYGILYNYPNKLFTNHVNWGNSSRYSLIIENSFTENFVETYWISDILFHAIDDENAIRMSNVLRSIDTPNNEYFAISRRSKNTFEIHFNDIFNIKYQHMLNLYVKRWGGELGTYCYFYDSEFLLNSGEASLFEEEKISRRYLAPYEFVFLTNQQLRLMRNAFYARHGYIFKNNELKKMFSMVFGYRENYSFNESLLTGIDHANIETIQKLETMIESTIPP
jgi:hypothetical protein